MVTVKSSATASPGKSLRLRAIARLREEITSGRFRPNERLVERELCELLDVSRTLIREALRQLEAEGLIIVAPNRGPFVAPLSLEDAAKIYEIRGVLEGMATKLFAARASDADRDALEAAWESMKVAYHQGGSRAILDAKQGFYDVLLRGAQNEIISEFLRQLHARVTRLRLTTLSIPGRADQSLLEIRRIMDAIKQRDGEAAWLATLEHIGNAASTANIVLSAIQQLGSGEAQAPTVRKRARKTDKP